MWGANSGVAYATHHVLAPDPSNTERLTCYILGSKIDPAEGDIRHEWDRRVSIIPMTYNTFIRRAEKRMLGLRAKLKDAPFLKQLGIDGEAFLTPPVDPQSDLLNAARPGVSAHP